MPYRLPPKNFDVLSPDFEKDNPSYNPKRDYCTMSPDKIAGVSIKKACYIHDYRYTVGATWEDKEKADKELRANIYKIGKDAGKKWLFLVVSNFYYKGVSTILSKIMFWRGK